MDDTQLTIVTPGGSITETTLRELDSLDGAVSDWMSSKLDGSDGADEETGRDLGYSGEDALNLARVARMKAGYSFSASHTGNAKLTTDNEGRRVLTVAFRITSRRKDFPQVAGRIMELLADVSKDDEVQVMVTPVIQQLPLM